MKYFVIIRFKICDIEWAMLFLHRPRIRCENKWKIKSRFSIANRPSNYCGRDFLHWELPFSFSLASVLLSSKYHSVMAYLRKITRISHRQRYYSFFASITQTSFGRTAVLRADFFCPTRKIASCRIKARYPQLEVFLRSEKFLVCHRVPWKTIFDLNINNFTPLMSAKFVFSLTLTSQFSLR